MRTRKSPRNQEILWRALGNQGATPEPAPPTPTPRTDAEIDAMWWIPKTSRTQLKRDNQRKGDSMRDPKGLDEQAVIVARSSFVAGDVPESTVRRIIADYLFALPPSAPSREEVAGWQRCPVCEGRGVVSYPPNTTAQQSGFTSSSCGPWPCPKCKGAMVLALYRPAGETRALNAMAADIAAGNQKWWTGPDGTPLVRNAGELLMLVVSEIVEAFEGERKNLMDDKLPHRRMAEVEIADAIVRLLDYSAARGYDLDGALREKLAFNATRADHKTESAQIAKANPLEFVSVRAALPPSHAGETK